MTELKEAQQAVEKLALQLEYLQQKEKEWVFDAHHEDEISQILETVNAVAVAIDGDVHSTMEKYRIRMKIVDPISNEPRFGPKTLAKITSMLETYDLLREKIVDGDLVKNIRERLETYMHENEQRKAESLRLAHEQREEDIRQQEILKVKHDQEERERIRLQEQVESHRVAELARLAQLKREEREKQRLIEEARVRDEQEKLARQNDAVEVGVKGLDGALKLLETALADHKLRRMAIQKILAILNNICSSPENPAFRQIPKENPHFHSDVGQYDGGHDCLRALGFKELEPEAGKRVFVMEEPDLSEDFDKWSQWFDRLKEMKEFLEIKLKTL